MHPPTEADIGEFAVSQRGILWRIARRHGHIGLHHKRWGWRYPVAWQNWRRWERLPVNGDEPSGPSTLMGGAGGEI